WEDAQAFDRLQQGLREEHQPSTPTEQILVEKMAQHYWLSQRAQSLQTVVMMDRPLDEEVQKELAPYIRYHAHYERLFQRALKDLLTLRAEKRKAEIGFVSQKAREAQNERSHAQETRRQSEEIRKQEQHKLKVAILETKLERELIQTGRINNTTTEPRASASGQNSKQTIQIAA
ncbi:MAG TPA: hypothetical protein VFA65_17075, partial [Bryobacteraceae bacterium]|nr:hypothetical protein [Bryobacteraceae bacterium]